MSGSYTPVVLHIGKLPNIPEETVTFNLGQYIPGNATEVFIYSFATTHNESSDFKRGYFEMYTSEGSKQFMQYMNIAVGPSIAINSANMWFPLSDNRSFTVKLVVPDHKKCIAYKKKGAKADDMSEYSDVFIIGYR